MARLSSARAAHARGELREAILGAELLLLELTSLYLLVGGERQVSLELGQPLLDLVVSRLQPSHLHPHRPGRFILATHADLLHASEPPSADRDKRTSRCPHRFAAAAAAQSIPAHERMRLDVSGHDDGGEARQAVEI